MSTSQWVHQHYNELVEEYGGKWILVKDSQILVADERFEPVFEAYKKIKHEPNTEITLIDDGEASFYAITNSSEENKTKK